MKLARVLFVALPLLLLGLLLGGCGPARSEGFAIYLLKDSVPPTRLAALSHVEIADQPLIAASDIISYEQDTHTITLTAAACTRVRELKVPTSGLSFAVCVDKAPVYSGAFWTPISSQSFDGVTIMQPAPNSEDNTITISLAYPSVGFFASSQPDPRGDSRVMDALRAAGKLK